MLLRKKEHIVFRLFIFILGLLIMSFGIVSLIVADLGAMPWDVFHVGLYYQFGLTIGTWNIITGAVVLSLASLIMKEFPQMGAFLNMVLCGLFVDMFYYLPFMVTPETFIGKMFMFISGIIIYGYGMGLYISAQMGAGPRDSLMIAISDKMKWKIRNVRAVMEILVLIIGFILGGPIYWGTIFFSLMVGPLAGMVLPQCQKFTNYCMEKLQKKKLKNEQVNKKDKRGVSL